MTTIKVTVERDQPVSRVGHHLFDYNTEMCVRCGMPRYGVVEFPELATACCGEAREAALQPKKYRQARDAALKKMK